MKTILIVDDEQTARHLLRYVLQLDGYHILSAHDAYEAVRILETGDKPDLVISDVMMPGMLGPDLVQYMAGKHELERIPVVLISAYHDLSRIGKTAAFVYKPYTPNALLTLVRELLDETSPPINSTREPRVITM
jgi:CheY-like chemotaxis protein